MFATASKGILVVPTHGFLAVKLSGEGHWELFQCYAKLPQVVEFEGRLYGKTGWDSEKAEAYFKITRNVAFAA